MKNSTRIHIIVMTLLITVSISEAEAQCVPPNSTDLTNKLVIDARPNAINKFDGRTKFKKDANIVVTNMNPFLYTYEIQVQQTEIKDTALFDIFQFLGSPLSDLLGIASVDRKRSLDRAGERPPVDDIGDLQELIDLTDMTTPPELKCDGAQDAMKKMIALRANILDRMEAINVKFTSFDPGYDKARKAYKDQVNTIFSPETTTVDLCSSTATLKADLTASGFPSTVTLEVFTKKDPATRTRPAASATPSVSLPTFASLVKELKTRAKFYADDSDYQNCKVKYEGFDFADSLQRLANTLSILSDEYITTAEARIEESQKYEFMQKAIAKLDTPGGRQLLWKPIDFHGQYDVSAFDVAVTPVAVQRREIPATEVAADPFRASERGTTTADRTSISLPFTNRLAPTQRDEDGGDSGGQTGGGSTNKTVASGTIGNRRFELSGGIVYSPLQRIEFQPVLGFARDEQGNIIDADGNPTTKKELTPIVGISEDSNHRVSPMIMLNTRLTEFRKTNLYFSLGFTGKKDSGGFDLEFLAGPSVNFFNNNLFFTVGAYAGRQQKLAGDLFLNAGLPEGMDKVPVRKEYEWKPGFSFTYRFPLKSRTEQTK